MYTLFMYELLIFIKVALYYSHTYMINIINKITRMDKISMKYLSILFDFKIK